MRKRDFGGFMLCFLMNLVFNLGWSVPAWILLAAHFILKISIWWFASLLIIWFFIILLRTLLISWAGDCASVRDEPKKNLNPYSASSSFGKADRKEETREKETWARGEKNADNSSGSVDGGCPYTVGRLR